MCVCLSVCACLCVCVCVCMRKYLQVGINESKHQAKVKSLVNDLNLSQVSNLSGIRIVGHTFPEHQQNQPPKQTQQEQHLMVRVCVCVWCVCVCGVCVCVRYVCEVCVWCVCVCVSEVYVHLNLV